MPDSPIDGPFGGRDGEAQNALRAALKRAAANAGYEGKYAEYALLQSTPRTTLVVFIVEALDELGYEIGPKRALVVTKPEEEQETPQ